MQYAGQSNLKRVSLECGGKSRPTSCSRINPDLDKAATAAAFAISSTGEMCSAGSRLLLRKASQDAVLEKVQAISRTLQPGDPLDPATQLGAIVARPQMKRVLGYIDTGRRDGASIRFRRTPGSEDSGGYFIEPTVFEGVKAGHDHRARGDFRPGAVGHHFKTVDEAIEIATT